MAKSSSKQQKSFLKRLKSTFVGLTQCEEIDIKESYHLPDKKIVVPLHVYPIQLNIGPDGKALHLYPENCLTDKQNNRSLKNYILFDPDTYYSKISGFFRLKVGKKLTLSRNNSQQRAFLNISKNIMERHLSITNNNGKLIFKNHDSKSGSCIAPLYKEKKINQIFNWRKKKLRKLRDIFGGPIETLPSKEALSLIQKVNAILKEEKYCQPDASGRPGGVLCLPKETTAFILGDLHTKLDSLLVILTQNGFLEDLEQGSASLIILGDAVHSEEEGEMDKMESSLLIMDFIFKLKVRFPKQVFYIRGNHDSFSEEIAKRGIPQGLLWEKKLNKSRGKEYRKEIERFYDQIPYVVFSKHYIACHAAPPTSSCSMEKLINIRKHPGLMDELINRRLKTPSRMSGYTKGDIKKFRKCLGVSPETIFIVGHTPMSTDETIWENVNDIKNHCIVYGGDSNWIGVMAQIGDKVYPFRYPVEPLTSIINSLSD